MTPLLSVVICTHNPRSDFLVRTLDGLRGQTLPAAQWELVIVDNASRVPVSADLSWHPAARIVIEPELGLTPARLRGISEARADLLLFVDDDNILDPDYLALATAIGVERADLGVWGCGYFNPEWEVAPSPKLAPFLEYLAVGQRTQDSISREPFDYLSVPAGAGLCVRAIVARAYADSVRNDPRRKLLGRRGVSLGGCEDFDLAQTAIHRGLGTGVFVRLRIIHLMPAARVRMEYLERLVEGHACSTTILHHLYGCPYPKPRRGLLAWLRRLNYHRSLSRIERCIDNARRRGDLAAHRMLGS